MTRFNAPYAGKRNRSVQHGAWLGLLLAGGCSLKSLDHLQSGIGKDDGASGGASGGQNTAELGGSELGGNFGTTAGGPSTTLVNGGTATELQTGVGASVAIGGDSTASGGVSSNTVPPVLGGKDGLGGASVGGMQAAGGELNVGGTSIALGGSASGGVATGGVLGSAGASGGTGASPSMIYNVLDQSCKRGLTCTGAVSCCSLIEVPGGTFTMGTNTDPDRITNEAPPHQATVDGFWMDKFEVTVGRFRSFADVYDGTMPSPNSGAHPKIAGSGWRLEYDANLPASKAALKDSLNCNIGVNQTWTESAGVGENKPINCVNWYVAFAFCIWDGGRLPTEAEWEMAAANGSDRRKYPWGEDAPNTTKHALVDCGGNGCTYDDILAVGTYADGANRWGHLDLAGNLWEWALDYYDATYYQSIGTCTNCANLAEMTPRVIRGGGFTSLLTGYRSTARTSKPPTRIDPYQGVRCVRVPK